MVLRTCSQVGDGECVVVSNFFCYIAYVLGLGLRWLMPRVCCRSSLVWWYIISSLLCECVVRASCVAVVGLLASVERSLAAGRVRVDVWAVAVVASGATEPM
eukprot:SAG31_NODE_4575_length_3124_cov_2.054545_1_plen_102_part_00